MDKKKILIIVAIVAVIAIIGAYFMFSDHVQTSTANQKTILLSKSAYMQVPDTKNATNKVDKKGIFYYKNKGDDVNITSCSNLSDASSSKELKKLKNKVATGSKKLKEDDVVIYEKDGVYSIFVKNTQYNDTLLIQSSDKSLLLQCWDSVKYHDPSEKVKVEDTGGSSSGSGDVIDVVKKTQSAVKTTSSSSSSSSSSKSSSSSSDSSWGYEWRSSGSSGSSSKKVSSVGGSASSDDLFDYS